MSSTNIPTDGDAFLVVPSNGSADRTPNWYHNLRANPECELRIATRSVPAYARTIDPDDPGFDRAWQLVNAVNRNQFRGYQQATTRRIPVVELIARDRN